MYTVDIQVKYIDMSYSITGFEQEPQEAFDWHHQDLFNNPPYSHTDMVYMLANGQFMIEGKRSDFSDAESYCLTHDTSVEAWTALKAVNAGVNEIALTGNVFIA